jgi:hypothetical protein
MLAQHAIDRLLLEVHTHPGQPSARLTRTRAAEERAQLQSNPCNSTPASIETSEEHMHGKLGVSRPELVQHRNLLLRLPPPPVDNHYQAR